MAKKFLHDVLPPYLTDEEKSRCVEHGGETWDENKFEVVNKVRSLPLGASKHLLLIF
jgi:hypothetical protein